MKAAVLKEIAAPIHIEEMGIPIPKENELLVKINAASINHRDIWISKGQYANIQLPAVLGSDAAGLIVENNALSTKRVIINPSLNWGDNEAFQAADYSILGMPTQGTFAEYIAVPKNKLHQTPTHLTDTEAAALPLAGLTAYRALMVQGGCKKGDKVLISGVGGGVAQFALQFALAAGAEVYVTSSDSQKIEKAITKGAKAGFDYSNSAWIKELKNHTSGIDLIIDGAGGEGTVNLLKVLLPGGRLVFYGGTRGAIPQLSPQLIFWKQLNIIGSTMGSDADFTAMLDFVNKHRIKPEVSKVFSLGDVNQAFEYIEANKHFGKVVLQMP